jgi:iron-sulfur cluster repair protein YtfE (RIC family)
MSTISSFMTEDHRACDRRLADVESLVQGRQWPEARAAWDAFRRAMARHFDREESLLFPAFERATGNPAGPTRMMRMEHDQMRAVFEQLEAAMVAQDRDVFLGLSDTLMVLVQQHNMKEEQILYPMSDRAIPDVGGLLAQMSDPDSHDP